MITYLATPLTKNRWMFQVFVDGKEITDSARRNGLLQLNPATNTAHFCRWSNQLVKTVMLQEVEKWGFIATGANLHTA